MPKAEGKSFNFEGKEKIRADFLEAVPFDGREEYIRIDTTRYCESNY